MNTVDSCLKRFEAEKTTAIRIDTELKAAREHIYELESSLGETVASQDQAWLDLLIAKIHARKQMYCRDCNTLRPSQGAKYLAVENRVHEHRRDYFVTTYTIVRLCKQCAEHSLARSPWYGQYSERAGGQPYMNAFEVVQKGEQWFKQSSTDEQEHLNLKKWFLGGEFFYECPYICSHLAGGKNHEVEYELFKSLGKQLQMPSLVNTHGGFGTTDFELIPESVTAAVAA